MHSRKCREESVEDATLRVVQQHAAELLRFARRFSHCADDAHDAYQRTLEILVRRVRSDPPAHPLKWFRTVLRHEALSIRAEQERCVGRSEVDFDRHEDREADDPAERVVDHERVQRTAEALQRLKPQELTALVLRAEGLSYREICARTGWTYTRANRTITEGRRALLERLDAIESGAECERWLPLLSALADGEATGAEVAELRPHLRACSACRATLRDCHALPARVAALVPPALAAAAAAPAHPSLLDHLGAGLQALAERATLLAARMQGALEAAPAAKLAAVAASTAAIAGGGVALEQASHAPAAQRREAAATVPSGGAGLAPSAFPVHAAVASARAAPRARDPRGEFAPPPAGPSEFAPRPAPRAEFAAASSASAGPSPPASAAAVAAARQSSEFAGP
jgi:RNA polymerase sigma factor (sigma-70 family)